MRLDPAEKKQLAGILRCPPRDVQARLRAFAAAAEEEYVRMILGQRVFTRGQDIREHRLLLLIQHVFEGRLPNEQTISSLFQTTTTQSRALLRAVMSKYQYELAESIRDTLRAALTGSEVRQGGEEGERLLTVDSENVVEALNRELAQAPGQWPQISKLRGSVTTYVIPGESYEKLQELLE